MGHRQDTLAGLGGEVDLGGPAPAGAAQGMVMVALERIPDHDHRHRR
jgi:hypothetical protein